jgi:hypothetical protein
MSNTKAKTYLRELLREAITNSLHFNIREKLDLLPLEEKRKYLEGYEEGLDTMTRIIEAELYLNKIEIVVKN